jgi:hypothetical protein
MALTRVLVTVKTYPNISVKYDELVCTAGIKEDGSWVRIYPVQFRQMPYANQYRKYDWIEVDLEKNTSDFRPESFKPKSDIKVVGHIDTKNNWEERKSFVLNNIYTSREKLVEEAKNKSVCTSLAVFKPAKIIDFVYESVEREWDSKKLEHLNQLNLFEQHKDKIEVVRKLPYKFSFIFSDEEGKESTLMIEDWETGQLFWNCLAKYNDEKRACEDVRKKYLDDFASTKDLYFFLGTTLQNHFVSRNPFIIIGTFHPKIETQLKLF